MTPHVMVKTTVPGRRRRAVAAVEFAVVASVMFLLVLGIIEFGRAFMVLELLDNAARNGARTGVLAGKSTADINNTVNNTLSSTGISGATTSVQVNDQSADASTANTGDKITVRVAVPANNVSWIPGGAFLKGKNLSATVIMRREGK